MRIFLLSFTLLFTTNILAGEIDDVFGAGVFGTKWGFSIHEVQATHPEGEKKSYGDIHHYKIKDGRTVLGVERSTSDEITFAFDSEKRLSSVGVYFDGSDEMGDLLSKLNTLFGTHIIDETDSVDNVQKWQSENVKVTLLLMGGIFNSKTILTIEYLALEKPGLSKSDLGF